MPSKTPSIALGAAVSVILSLALSFAILGMGTTGQAIVGCATCLLVFIGPLVAVWHYTSTHRVTLPAGPGAGLGAITGAVGALVAGLVQQVLILANLYPDAAELLERQREQMIASGLDPAQIDQAMQMAETMGGMASNPILGIGLNVLIGAVIGAIGGAVGAAIFKKGPLEPEL